MRVVDKELDIQINGVALSLGPDRAGSVRTLTGSAANVEKHYVAIGACNVDVAAGSPGTDLNTADNLTIIEVRQSPRNRREPVKVEPSNDGKQQVKVNLQTARISRKLSFYGGVSCCVRSSFELAWWS